MRSFRSEVQRRILALNGHIEELIQTLEGQEVAHLDQSIMKLAAEVIISPAHFTAFQLAYICKPTWEEIADLYMKHFPHRSEDLEVDTVKKYAREAKKRVFERANLAKAS